METEKDFSRYGRVNYVLSRRLHLLDEVKRLQESLGVQGDVSYTCETAGHFYLYQIIRRYVYHTGYLHLVIAQKYSMAPCIPFYLKVLKQVWYTVHYFLRPLKEERYSGTRVCLFSNFISGMHLVAAGVGINININNNV